LAGLFRIRRASVTRINLKGTDMARITSVMAGLACLALMCFAVPIASAAPTDHLMFDSGPGYELVVAPAAVEFVAVADNFELAVPMIAAEAAADVKMVGCPTVPPAPDDGPGAATTSSPLLCTSRRYDPGWRAG
jgi:hypothetical protein